MLSHAHALMQDAHDADAVGVNPIDNNVGSDQIAPVCRWQIVPAVAKLRVASYGLQCIVDLVTLGACRTCFRVCDGADFGSGREARRSQWSFH